MAQTEPERMTREQIVEAIREGGFLTVPDVIALFDLSPSHAYKAVREGKIPSIAVAGAIRIPRTWADRLIRDQLAEHVELERGRVAYETALANDRMVGAA